jgi:hypothetical protein
MSLATSEDGRVSITKRLLKERGDLRLCEVIAGTSTVYIVETPNESRRYGLLYSAQSKFERLSVKSGGPRDER